EALQPAPGPVRARRHHLEHVLGMVARERLPDPRGLHPCRRVPPDVRRVPAAPESGELHDRSGRRQARERDHLGPMRLASWNDRPARAAILDYLERIRDVERADRIAVVDNDGTLW